MRCTSAHSYNLKLTLKDFFTFQTLIEILKEPSLGEEIDETTIHLVTSLLLVSHTTLLVENSVKLISQVSG